MGGGGGGGGGGGKPKNPETVWVSNPGHRGWRRSLTTVPPLLPFFTVAYSLY